MSKSACKEMIGYTTPIGEGGQLEMRLSEIREQVLRGDYQVDAKAVADAIMRRLLREHRRRRLEQGPAQGACS